MVSEARSSVLASQALATDPFQRFLQARPARKLRLTDRRMLFRRDPDFVDAPETARNDGFRQRFTAVRVLAGFLTPIYGYRPKASFAPKGWPENVAGNKYSFAPHGH